MKKLIVIVLWFASVQLIAQCKLEENKIDEFTKEVKKTTEETLLGKYKLWKLKSRIARVDDSYYLLVFWGTSLADYPSLGCLTDKSYVMLKLANDETITLNHQGKIDCGSTGIFYTKLDSATIDKIKATPVIKLRYSREYYIELEMKDKNAVGDMIRCVQI